MRLSKGMRAGIAVSLVLALLAGSITVVGMTSRAQIALPERHAGDQVVYADGEHERRYTQLQVMAWKDVRGIWHQADTLSLLTGYTIINGERQDHFAYSMLDDTGAPMAASFGASIGASASSGASGSTSSRTSATDMIDGRTFHPCGFVNSLQGGAASDRLTTSGLCAGRTPKAAFTWSRMDEWSGDPVHVFAADGRGASTELWFRQDLPYPVRIRDTDDGVDVDMVGFRPGAATLRAPQMPADTPIDAPPHRVFNGAVPLFDHLDYSLRDALADARDGEEGATITAFEAAHPDAIVTSAETSISDDAVRWSMEIADATRKLRITVFRAASDMDGPLATLGLASPWQVTTLASERATGWWVAPADWAPGVVPVTWVEDAWKTYAASTDAASTLGFASPRCDSGCGPEVYAGGLDLDEPPEPGPLDLDPQPFEASGQGFVFHATPNESYIEWVHRSTASKPTALGTPAARPTASDSNSVPAWVPPNGAVVATVGVGAIMAGAMVWLLTGLKGAPMFALWSRRSKDHPVRQTVLALVKAEPGIHYQAIVRSTGLGNGAVEHHLRKLVSRGDLIVARDTRYTCYYPAGTRPQVIASAGAVKSEGARKVLAAIQQAPGVAVSEVTRTTGLSPGTVSHHLRRLRQGGLVDSWRDGRTVRMRAIA